MEEGGAITDSRPVSLVKQSEYLSCRQRLREDSSERWSKHQPLHY